MYPSIATIDLSAIVQNLQTIKARVGKSVKILAVVKSDGYGHGLVPVAKKLSSAFDGGSGEGVDGFGVSLVYEGITLRKAGLTEPVLILGGAMEGEEGAVGRHDLTPVVSSVAGFKRLEAVGEKNGQKIKVHIKVDTGMSRLGMSPGEVSSAIQEFSTSKSIFVEGLCTHLAFAYQKDRKKNTEQLNQFEHLVNSLKKTGYSIPLVHACNSAGIFSCPEAHYDMVRPGIALYGSSPFEHPFPDLLLKQAMRWETRIHHIRKLDKGASVSYGGNFTVSRESRIAVLPIGYSHGLHRGLSGKIDVLVGSKRVSQVGSICMDFTTIDISRLEDCRVGDEVVLLGKEGGEEISASEMAGRLGTIPYEIYCHVGRLAQRKYVE